jgi:hypothetical protein
MNLLIPTTEMGRPLPTVDVGYPVAQLGGPLSGGELARPTGACRPTSDIRHLNQVAVKPSFKTSSPRGLAGPPLRR